MKKTLYDVSDEYINAYENITIDEETGELLGMEALYNIKDEFNKKAEAIAIIIKSSENFTEDLKVEKKNIDARIRQNERKTEWLKSYLTSCMDKVNLSKFETTKCKISFRKSETVEVYDTLILPEEFRKAKVEYTADKTAIKKAIKAGLPVTGAVLIEKNNIQIK